VCRIFQIWLIALFLPMMVEDLLFSFGIFYYLFKKFKFLKKKCDCALKKCGCARLAKIFVRKGVKKKLRKPLAVFGGKKKKREKKFFSKYFHCTRVHKLLFATDLLHTSSHFTKQSDLNRFKMNPMSDFGNEIRIINRNVVESSLNLVLILNFHFF
jgi:hypothetical protein